MRSNATQKGRYECWSERRIGRNDDEKKIAKRDVENPMRNNSRLVGEEERTKESKGSGGEQDGFYRLNGGLAWHRMETGHRQIHHAPVRRAYYETDGGYRCGWMMSRGFKPDRYPSMTTRHEGKGCAGMVMRQLGRVISPFSKISATEKAKDGATRVCPFSAKKAALHRFGFGSAAECR